MAMVVTDDKGWGMQGPRDLGVTLSAILPRSDGNSKLAVLGTTPPSDSGTLTSFITKFHLLQRCLKSLALAQFTILV